jgi:oxygen-independent coproporphyrinogen III oxidase
VAFGIYISVPFCRTKCTYCNFASDVFSRAMFARYVDRVCADVASAQRTADELGGEFEREIDSIYLGGGTPTVLDSAQLERMFAAVREQFDVQTDAEITVECAPGTLTPAVLDALLRCGVNRVSLGVQSFVDGEAASVGRLHKRATVLEDISRLRGAGITNLNFDLIAGLPHQTAESWKISLDETLATGVPHASVYMLEVDDDSRLGRELIAGGTRYHAHFVPDENAVADFYLAACETFSAAGVAQYEISNFAHSMLRSTSPREEAVRFATADALEKYVAGGPLQKTAVSREGAIEEFFFLGLRLNRGVNLSEIAQLCNADEVRNFRSVIVELVSDGLLQENGDFVQLTSRGRLLSNEVFERFLAPATVTTKT